ncbi:MULTISPECIES: sensor domain-containing diguanylate cyclase [Deefgea]|uniref:diguanylate cyclase n=1 Tax=Deefgea chitinilytica TaxID=570276 RepID=A0ABS2CC00_9NEIS|nr:MULTISPECIES: sensor domain-containing diguanylate cyclase [Deefgea]MBM5571679.1 diguanylate cyclase [Deefgea chitinilytica]MBM9888914.1 GGDEF domain-containing protein [Deefgea sp. CFH1-16]
MISSDLLQALFDISPAGIAIADQQGRYLQVNDSYCCLFGYSRAELIGNTFRLILTEQDQALEAMILNLALTQDRSAPTEWQVRHKSGRTLFVHSAFKTFFYSDGSAKILTVLSDVSALVCSLNILQDQEAQLIKTNESLEQMVSRRTIELERANDELARLATQDFLTATLNRRAFECEASKIIYASDRYHRPASFMFLDIDHFKAINDQYGHAAGDVVLQKLALNIRALLRESDLLARWGGEEFVVCLPDTVLADAIVVGDKILEACRQMKLSHQQFSIALTVSGGVVQRTLNESLHEVLQKADVLLYEAKRTGRNRLLSEMPASTAANEAALLNFHI